MAIVTGAAVAGTGKLVATKIAAKKTKDIVVKEVNKRVKREIVKRTVGKTVDASESETLAKIAKPVVKDLSGMEGGRIDTKGLPTFKTEVFKNGPKDIQFDLNKNPQGSECRVFDESKFLAGTEKIAGRKPTPDAVLVDSAKKEILFVEDKRPSECAHNSWLSTFDKDSMREFREAQAQEYVRHEVAREKAEARIVIKEHDMHMDLRPERWRNPDGLPTGFNEKLLIRIPSDQAARIEAIYKELFESGRNPEICESRGVTSIKYNLERPTWEAKEVGEENGKKVYELNAGKNADGTRNPERVLLNQHPLPENSIFKVKMAGGVEATYETDSQGRVCKMSVKEVKIVPDQDRLRDSNRTGETKNIKDGCATDDGGHLLGDEFGGASDQINLVPMDGHVNEHGDWRLMEKNIESALKGPPEKAVTDLTVVVRYEGSSSRPTSFRVSYRVEGDPKPKVVSIPNVSTERTVRNAA